MDMPQGGVVGMEGLGRVDPTPNDSSRQGRPGTGKDPGSRSGTRRWMFCNYVKQDQTLTRTDSEPKEWTVNPSHWGRVPSTLLSSFVFARVLYGCTLHLPRS